MLLAQTVTSPDGELRVEVGLDDGAPTYQVWYAQKVMLEPSPLGLETSIGSFSSGLAADGHAERRIDETYVLPHGKARSIHYQANELTCRFRKDDHDAVEVLFRVSNNDIALAYRITSNNKTRVVVTAEKTGFNLPDDATTFITPQAPYGTGWMGTKPSYEEGYTVDQPVGTPSRYGLGYTFPCLFHLGDDGWVLVSETGVNSQYVGTRLSEGTKEGLYTIAFPEEAENAGIGDPTAAFGLPGMTSWKTITVGDTLKPIVETTVSYDVVEPLIEPSIEYRSGRSVWSWLIWQDGSINYEDQKTYIDLAAALNFEYALVDNWWDQRIGRDRIPDLVQYAASKGVGIILWYNSNGAWNDAPQTPQDRMDTAPARQKEMEWLRSVGVKGIKVDFFGGDKQHTMALYEDILTDANRCGIHVNFHGATLPRGWEKMFPNHMTSEAVLGSENAYFSQGYCDTEALTSTLLPFTRNTTAAMDFGPVYLNQPLSRDQKGGNTRRTTDAFQLATAVLYQSGIQHFGLTPDNLEQPDDVIDYLKKVPSTWDETRFVEGYPGKYVVLARRSGDTWYIVATNAEDQPKEIALNLPSFKGRTMDLLHDKDDRSAGFRQVKVDPNGEVKVTLAPAGGAVLMGTM